MKITEKLKNHFFQGAEVKGMKVKTNRVRPFPENTEW